MNAPYEGGLSLVRLGPFASTFVSRCLADGRSLARRIHSYWPINLGSVHAIVPRVVSVHSVEDLERGGVYRGKRSGREWLAQGISEHLVGRWDQLCLVECSLSRRGDPVIRDREVGESVRVVFNGDDVYHLLTSRDSGHKRINDAVRLASSCGSMVVALSACSGMASSGRELNEPRTLEIVSQLSAVFIEAFDGEGFVRWTPNVAS